MQTASRVYRQQQCMSGQAGFPVFHCPSPRCHYWFIDTDISQHKIDRSSHLQRIITPLYGCAPRSWIIATHAAMTLCRLVCGCSTGKHCTVGRCWWPKTMATGSVSWGRIAAENVLFLSDRRSNLLQTRRRPPPKPSTGGTHSGVTRGADRPGWHPPGVTPEGKFFCGQIYKE